MGDGEAGRVGAGTNMYGSEIGPPVDQPPVVPGMKLVGALFGAPTTAKSLPVKLGPPLLRSMVGLPLHWFAEPLVAAAQVELLELTSTLRVGPPMIFTVLLPLSSKECWQEGLSTIMGTGAVELITAHTALAETSAVRLPVMIPLNVVGTRSKTFTRMKAFGTVVVGGMHGGGTVELHVCRPAAELGKLIFTSLDTVFATRPGALYPLNAAY